MKLVLCMTKIKRLGFRDTWLEHINVDSERFRSIPRMLQLFYLNLNCGKLNMITNRAISSLLYRVHMFCNERKIMRDKFILSRALLTKIVKENDKYCVIESAKDFFTNYSFPF